MIKLIAAIDKHLGIVDEYGLSWKIKTDLKHFRNQTIGSKILMGSGTYKTLEKPLENRQNFVLTSKNETLRPGFIKVSNLEKFLNDNKEVWIIGGADVFEQTINIADELYLTRIDKDFKCTKFFPEFSHKFIKKSAGPSHYENGLKFHFEVWSKITHNLSDVL